LLNLWGMCRFGNGCDKSHTLHYEHLNIGHKECDAVYNRLQGTETNHCKHLLLNGICDNNLYCDPTITLHVLKPELFNSDVLASIKALTGGSVAGGRGRGRGTIDSRGRGISAGRGRSKSAHSGNRNAIVKAEIDSITMALADLKHQNDLKEIEMKYKIKASKENAKAQIAAAVQTTTHLVETHDLRNQIELEKMNTVVKVAQVETEHAKEMARKAEIAAEKAAAKAAERPSWWPDHGIWGPWAGWQGWGGTNPTYCVHGNIWAHCSTGPPRFCNHGSNWGVHCPKPPWL